MNLDSLILSFLGTEDSGIVPDGAIAPYDDPVCLGLRCWAAPVDRPSIDSMRHPKSSSSVRIRSIVGFDGGCDDGGGTSSWLPTLLKCYDLEIAAIQ